MESVETLHAELLRLAEAVNERVEAKLSERERDFMRAFSEKMRVLSLQLKDLKVELEEKALRIRADRRLFVLEQERDYFRQQVSVLQEDRKAILEENVQLKARLDEKEAELKESGRLLVRMKQQEQRANQELASIYQSSRASTQATPRSKAK